MAGGLATVAPEHEIVAFAPTGIQGTRRVREALEPIPVERRLVTLPGAYAWRLAWSKSGRLPLERILGPFDVFHFSDWMYPPQRAGVRATTIHDLVPLHFPELVHPRTRRMHGAKYRHAAATCDVVFTNSRFTAADVAEHLQIPSERIRVAHPGIDARFRPDGERAELGAPYVLTVSTLDPRKNVEVVMDAFRLVRRQRPELLLAVVGGLAPGAAAPADREGVRMLGFVDDPRLAALYRGASAFAYASRFEGFGVPVVEALACGVRAARERPGPCQAIHVGGVRRSRLARVRERALRHCQRGRDRGRYEPAGADEGRYGPLHPRPARRARAGAGADPEAACLHASRSRRRAGSRRWLVPRRAAAARARR